MLQLGKQQEYNLGLVLRQRYNEFIGAYSPEKINILSSNYDRTINSANLVLAALFPPKGNQVWNTDLHWQSIAVHSIPKEMDCLIHAEKCCHRYLQARNEFEQSSEVQALKKQHQGLFEYLEMHSGQPVRTLEHLKDIYETIDIEYHFNKT